MAIAISLQTSANGQNIVPAILAHSNHLSSSPLPHSSSSQIHQTSIHSVAFHPPHKVTSNSPNPAPRPETHGYHTQQSQQANIQTPAAKAATESTPIRKNAEPRLELLNQHFEYKKNALEQVCGVPAAKALIDYAKFHGKVLEGIESPRHLVSVPVEAGLADRLTGVISLFWLAFFSRSAFQIGSYHNLPRFEAAFDYVFVNWTRTVVADEEKYTAPAMFTYKGKRGFTGVRRFESSVDNSKNHLEYMINNGDRTRQIFQGMDLSRYPTNERSYPSEQHVFASSNRGAIHHLFNNEHHRNYLQNELQLNSGNAFRCAYHFLFQENDNVRAAMSAHAHYLEPSSLFSITTKRNSIPGKSELVNMLPHKNHHHDKAGSSLPPKLKIGIGIRVGDEAFDPEKDQQVKLEQYQDYISCAEYLGEGLPSNLLSLVQHPTNDSMTNSTTSTSEYPILWYVMSESLHLRQLIHDKYGDRIITDYNTTYFHGDCNSKTHGGCHQDKLDNAIIYAVAQLSLFSLCDVQIVSESGFPRISAEVAKEPHLMFMLSMYHTTSDLYKVCQLKSPADHNHLQSQGCGIRKHLRN